MLPLVRSRACSNFYPRPPRGGRPAAQPSCSRSCYFYPRPPRGGRRASEYDHGNDVLFLSTPSARRATALGIEISRNVHISIHALREEGDADMDERVRWLEISIHALREEGD